MKKQKESLCVIKRILFHQSCKTTGPYSFCSSHSESSDFTCWPFGCPKSNMSMHPLRPCFANRWSDKIALFRSFYWKTQDTSIILCFFRQTILYLQMWPCKCKCSCNQAWGERDGQLPTREAWAGKAWAMTKQTIHYKTELLQNKLGDLNLNLCRAMLSLWL